MNVHSPKAVFLSKAGVFSLIALLLALILTGVNLWLLPLGDGRDELAHLRLIEFYHQERRFPQLPDDWDAASIQAHQPPLYYMLMAGVLELGLDNPGSEARYQPNPFANYDFYPEFRYNRVAYINDWRGLDEGPIRSWHILRGLSVLINGAAILFFWRAARLFFPEENAMGVPLSLAFLTLAPGFLQVTVGLNNNNMLFLFSTLATWMLIRLLRLGLRWKTSIALGIALGLGLLTKIYMFPLIVAAPLVYLSLPRRDWRSALKHLTLVGGLVIGIAGWWYVRNTIRYGDPSAASETEKLLRTARADSIDLAELWGLVTLWGGKLWLEAATVYMTLTWLEVISWILLMIFLGGVAGLYRGRLAAISVRGAGHLALGTFIPALLLAIYGAERNLHGDQSPPIMRAALPVLCLFFAASLLVWIPARWRDWVVTAAVILLGGFAIFWQVTYFLPQYPPLNRVDADEHALQIDFENGARLIDTQISENHLRPGERASVTLCWQALPTIDNTINAAFTVQLVHPDHPAPAATDGFPLSGRFPMSIWQPGDQFCEEVPLHVTEDVVTPRAYDLRVGLYIPDGEDLTYLRDDGSHSNFLIVDQVGITGMEKAAIDAVIARVDDWGALADYSLVVDGESLALTLDWTASGTTLAEYNIFLHVLDGSGDLVAQLDRPPMFPTRFWQDGVTFTDRLSLEIPDDAAGYRFGLYDPVTGERGMWMVDGESAGDHLMLELDS